MYGWIGFALVLLVSRAVTSYNRRTGHEGRGAPWPLRLVVGRSALASAALIGINTSWQHPMGFAFLSAALGCALLGAAWSELFIVRVAVPRGWVHWTILVERLAARARPGMESDKCRALQVARAVLRRPSASRRAFLESMLLRQDLSGNGACARAVLALQGGERGTALDVFEALDALDPNDLHHEVHIYARAVLTLDALASGRPLLAAQFVARSPSGRLTQLFGQLLQPPRTLRDRLELWIAWLRAPARRHTRPIVVRALTARPAPLPSVSPVRPSLEAFAALLSKPVGLVEADDVEAAIASLDALRSQDGFVRDCERRAQTLGIDARSNTDAFFAQACARLAQLVLDLRFPLHSLPRGELAKSIGERVREVRMARVHTLCSDLERRVSDQHELPPFDEWRAWNTLRRAVRDAESLVFQDRKRVFDIAHGALALYVDWLIYSRNQKTLGYAIHCELEAMRQVLSIA